MRVALVLCALLSGCATIERHKVLAAVVVGTVMASVAANHAGPVPAQKPRPVMGP